MEYVEEGNEDVDIFEDGNVTPVFTWQDKSLGTRLVHADVCVQLSVLVTCLQWMVWFIASNSLLPWYCLATCRWFSRSAPCLSWWRCIR